VDTIDDPERAKRLANAICRDIPLYQQAAVSGVAPAERTRLLAEPVREAYALYASRVSAAQLHWLDEAIATLHAELGAPYHGIAPPEPARMPHPPVSSRTADETPAASRSGSPIAVVASIAILVVLGGLAFLLSR
jgi:hypothetical protein